MIKRAIIFIVWAVFLSLSSVAQEAAIVLGKKELPITEYFTVGLKVRGKFPVPVTTANFPEITGFKKSNLFSRLYQVKTDTTTYNEEIITQNYAPLQEGKIPIKPFSIKIGTKTFTSKAFIVTILPEPILTANPANPAEPAQTSQELKPDDIKSYLSLETNKNKVYEGEGLELHLYFYLASSEQGLLNFYQFNRQFVQLSKNLKQDNVWEDLRAVNEEKPDTLKINNQEFIRFKLYQSTLYPLGTKPLQFPTLTLNMQARAKDQQYATPSKAEQIISFFSKPKKVIVKPLPSHPNKNEIAVGEFQMQEGINKSVFETDKSFVYTFVITGKGNFSSVTMPEAYNLQGLEVFAPIINQSSTNLRNGIVNRKEFKFTILPKAAGRYNLGSIFKFPFFNVATGTYDTLRSELTLNVKGASESVFKANPESTDDFYKLIAEEKNELVSLHSFDQIKLYTNVVVLFLLCVSLFLFFKK